MTTTFSTISHEDRAAIIAAYHDDPTVTKVVAALGHPYGVVRRVLEEAGIKKDHRRKRPPDEQIREVIAPLWASGASYDEMKDAIGTRVTNAVIRGVMSGIPRRRIAMSHRLAAAELPEDASLWIWYAGVLDARGSLSRITAGGYAISVSTGADREFPQLLKRLVGAGVVMEKQQGPIVTNYSHQIYRQADVVAVLRRVAPLLRHKQTLAYRVIAELEERGG